MTGNPDPKAFWPILVSTLQLLAADYDEQVSALPDFVQVPDELALNFDDAMVLVPQMRAAGLLDDTAVQRLQELDQALRNVSEWTLDALRSDPKWAAIRQQARELLAYLGQPRGPIDLSWGTYVPGKRSPQQQSSTQD